MVARVTTYELAESTTVSDATAAFAPAIDQIRRLGGLVDAYFLVERDGRRALSITFWDSRGAMEASRVPATIARTGAAERAGADVLSTYELEVAIHADPLAADGVYESAMTT